MPPACACVRLLKWLTLALLSCAAVLFSLHLDWGAVLAGALHPRLSMDRDNLLTVVAVFGTTISPYLFFWQAGQAGQEMEDGQAAPGTPHTPAEMRLHLRPIKWDTPIGMGFSNPIAFSIIAAAGST